MQSVSSKTDLPRWPKPPHRSIVATTITLLFGAAVLFSVPYCLPASRTVSSSYLLGYSTRGALALLLLFLAGFAAWHGPVSQRPASSSSASMWPYLFWLAVLVGACGAWEFAVQAHLGPRQEGIYFIDRLDKFIAGAHVYRDFELAYGAALLYVPYLLHKVLGLSSLSAYSLSLIVENLLGLGLLGYAVRVVAGTNPRRFLILILFTLTALGWVPLAGAQYTLLRYWLGPACALFSLQQLHRGRPLVAGMVTAAGLLLTFLVSQEQSIALLLGWWLFTLVFCRQLWSRLLPALLLLTIMEAALLLFAFRARALDTLLSLASGAYAVPIMPTPTFFLVFGLMAVAACVMVEAIRTRATGSPELLLLCLAPWTLTAAFGRCDPQHMLSNTSVAALVAWTTLARNKTWWPVFLWSYGLLTFLYPTQLKNVYHIESLAIRRDPFWQPRESFAGLPRFYSPEIAIPETWSQPAPLFLTRSGRYYGLTDVVQPAQVHDLIEELRQNTRNGQVAAVLPDNCASTLDPSELVHLTGSTVFPTPKRSNPFLQPLCEEIRSSRYRRVTADALQLPKDVVLITSR